MITVQEQARAKINLILDVTGKRPDGYHELRTVFQSVFLCDTVTLSYGRPAQITLSCNRPDLPVNAENLAWRAASLLGEAYRVSQGVHISLEKRIPVAAGLGGGSSDAAAVLRGLVRFWGLPEEPDVLHSLAAQLGSDVPFCLRGGTALGSGRGETLEALPPCPHFYVVLANPGIPVSTARVYRHLAEVPPGASPDVDGLVMAVWEGDAAGVSGRLANVLERSTFSLYPAVKALKDRMLQGAPALMCGSGATVFALSGCAQQARRLYESLLKAGISAWLTETFNQSEEGCGYV
jgi:4-diphosphocytidyl-2-C-methyl-D-erythritol kinase